MKTRLRAIDALRGCAALAVVSHHAINYSEHLPDAWWLRAIHAVFDRGYLGVPLFFVISGFCIHLRWASAQAERGGNTDVSFLDFWKRRLRRLYPPYFVALCVSMGLVVVAFAAGRHVALVNIYPDPKPTWMGVDFLLHATMLHGFHPVFDRTGGNPPFWTLAREEYFYILYFALIAGRRRVSAITLSIGVLLLSIVFPIFVRPIVPASDEWTTLMMSSAAVLWIQWCLGMVAVEGYFGLVTLPAWCSNGLLAPLWAGAAAYADNHAPLVAATLWGMSFFTLINCWIKWEVAGKWPALAWVKAFERVGIYSYSLYLVHNPVRGVLNQVISRFGPAGPWQYLLTAAFIATIGVLVGKIFFLIVERRFLPKPRPPVTVPSRLTQTEALAEI